MSVIAVASLLATQGTATLLFQPKVGTTYKYSNTVVTPNPMTKANQTITSTSSMNVKSFSGGYYTISVTSSNVKVTGGGNAEMTKKMMEGRSTTMVMDKFGSPKIDAKNMSAGMQQMMNGLGNNGAGVMFPKHPVKVGETWSNTVDMGKATAAAMKANGAAGAKTSGKLTVTFKLLKLDGSTATISSSLTGSMDMDMSGMAGANAAKGQPMKMSMTMSGGGSYTIERATGMMTGSNMKMNVGVMGQNITTTMTSKKI